VNKSICRKHNSRIILHQKRPVEKADILVLNELFYRHFDQIAKETLKLPASGSVREYYRLKSGNSTAIGAFNKDIRENMAFFTLTRHFRWLGLNVPDIFEVETDQKHYLLQDLGDTTLFSYLQEAGSEDKISEKYFSAVENLLDFQFIGHRGLDYNICYPRKAFDKQSMMWDLNYFKHYFIRLAGVTFDEQALENDFHTFTNFLMQAGTDNFMFRDFQSRNIMVFGEKLYFIDYQGGRRGPLQYDLASLLFDAKANLSPEFRLKVMEHYIETGKKQFGINPEIFNKFFYPIVLIRIMQAFGAYGYRGFFERKTHFLQSIPFALKNLEWIFDHYRPELHLPELYRVFEQILVSKTLSELSFTPASGLTVSINSFSYKKSYPLDNSGNGGGFVFDCRFLPNPGRFAEYAELNGKDPRVIAFFESKQETNEFLKNVFAITDAAISNYLERKFYHLMISFGCTGGQHRSVYFAEKLAQRYAGMQGVNVRVKHFELDKS